MVTNDNDFHLFIHYNLISLIHEDAYKRKAVALH